MQLRKRTTRPVNLIARRKKHNSNLKFDDDITLSADGFSHKNREISKARLNFLIWHFKNWGTDVRYWGYPDSELIRQLERERLAGNFESGNKIIYFLEQFALEDDERYCAHIGIECPMKTYANKQNL